MHLRRLVLLPCVALIAFVSCSKPKTFDAVIVKRVHVQSSVSTSDAMANGFRRVGMGLQWATAVRAAVQPSAQLDPPPSVQPPATTPTVVSDAPEAAVARPSYPSSLQPCGGDLPPCWRVAIESGGDYNAISPASFCGGNGCFGKYQFSGAWAGKLGLPLDLSTATPEQQDAAARELWAGGAGCSNWASCG